MDQIIMFLDQIRESLASEQTMKILSPILSKMAWIVIGGAVTYFFIWWRDRKRENKYRPARKDIISFLKNFSLYQNGVKQVGEFYDDIGDYRFRKIRTALEKMNILIVQYTQDGCLFNIQNSFHTYKRQDIKNIIRDVKKGCFDNVIEV